MKSYQEHIKGEKVLIQSVVEVLLSYSLDDGFRLVRRLTLYPPVRLQERESISPAKPPNAPCYF